MLKSWLSDKGIDMAGKKRSKTEKKRHHKKFIESGFDIFKELEKKDDEDIEDYEKSIKITNNKINNFYKTACLIDFLQAEKEIKIALQEKREDFKARKKSYLHGEGKTVFMLADFYTLQLYEKELEKLREKISKNIKAYL